MRTYVRAVTVVLLIVLALDLGDWPYVDEILADVPPIGSASGMTNEPSETQAPDRSGAPEKSIGAYQLLLHLGQFALNGATAVITTAKTQPTLDLRSSIYDSVVPDRLYRPPIVPLLS